MSFNGLLRSMTLNFASLFFYMYKPICFLVVLAWLTSCNNHSREGSGDKPVDNSPPIINYSVAQVLQHDTSSFTEGLLVHDGQLYESTGTEPVMPPSRHSLFGILDPHTGKISVKAEIDRNKYFGEGISFLNNKVYQLTWTTKLGFIYDAKTFSKLGEFAIPVKEGWGMTTDSTHLIMSDGTEKLTYLDTANLSVVRTLTVTNEGQKLKNVNELEYVDGYIYANVYETSWVVKIDPTSGKVVGRLDLSPITEEVRRMYPNIDYLNGIAYDTNSKAFLVTGKNWPKAFLIRIQKPAVANP